jgi:hypothetical protein
MSKSLLYIAKCKQITHYKRPQLETRRGVQTCMATEFKLRVATIVSDCFQQKHEIMLNVKR